MKPSDFASNLQDLAIQVENKIDEEKRNGNLIDINESSFKFKIDNFDYDLKDFFLNYDLKPEMVNESRTILKNEREFFVHFQNETHYKKIIHYMIRTFKLSEDVAKEYLSVFINQIISKKIKNNNVPIIDCISRFILDLEKSPLTIKISIFLTGVWLEDENFELDDSVRIRRPTSLDIERLHNRFEGNFPVIIIDIGTILEINKRFVNEKEMSHEENFYRKLFEIFKIGSVDCFIREYKPESIIELGYSITNQRDSTTMFAYKINNEDISVLKKLVKTCHDNIKPTNLEEVNPITISLNNFSSATCDVGLIEYRISCLIMALEALFLKGKERSELSHRLSQRIAILLKIFEFQPLEVYSILMQAYDFRSSYVHGSQLDTEERIRAEKISLKLFEYVRICILLFIQIRTDKFDKDALINKIDHSILDEKEYTQMKKTLEENCFITRTDFKRGRYP